MRLLTFFVCIALVCSPVMAVNKVTFDHNGVIEVNGKKMFVISFSLPPPADRKTPAGKGGLAELKDGGANWLRVAPPEKTWDAEAFSHVQKYLDAAARNGMFCWVTIGEFAAIPENGVKRQELVRQIVTRFKDHPGLGGWKSTDEPAWGKVPVENCARGYKLIKQLDPNHPVICLQAPQLMDAAKPYMAASDVTGADIYPLAYPPGKHSDLPNKQMSVVGDVTKKMMEVANGQPLWMTLQIAWSGVVKEGKQLRFPTFHEQRYMTYQAIIDGARGINYFGGQLPTSLSPRDTQLGWNWNYWDRVLRDVVAEIGEKSPLYPALLAGNSKLPVKVSGADDVEFVVRDVGAEIFILAAKREGETVQVKFTGLPSDGEGEVMFESPRKIVVKGGVFEEWFAPNEVHVYRLKR